MLDSEKAFKIKVMSHWTVSKFCLRQQLFAWKTFARKQDCQISLKLQMS